jgi:hypothetical protein
MSDLVGGESRRATRESRRRTSPTERICSEQLYSATPLTKDFYLYPLRLVLLWWHYSLLDVPEEGVFEANFDWPNLATGVTRSAGI